MFSQTSEYAIRALIEIATRPEGEHVLSSELGESLGIPQHYLSKILQQLVRTRVLKSVRGRSGGFRLARSAADIRLRDIVEPFEDLKKCEECILGQPVCSDAGACPLHDFWGDVRERYVNELETKSLADLTDYQLKKLGSMNAGLFKRVGSVPGKESLKQKSKRKKVGTK
ncbi:MAG: Rrf2 family transcriptional regulator [Planctomycetes bacterium]|nr:Rrf2 family transcriptional regulator [Planctomycetota bacterium]